MKNVFVDTRKCLEEEKNFFAFYKINNYKSYDK